MILTYKYRLKDRNASKALRLQATAINQVWNFLCATQRETQARYRSGAPAPWLSGYDFNNLTAGSSRLLGIQARSINEVCRIFTKARDKKRDTPSFRVSFGPRRSLGWVPFRNGKCDFRLEGNLIVFNGKRYRFFGQKRRSVPPIIKCGCFVEDALGRWYVCFVVEIPERPTKANAAIGVDLGLKSFATLSDGTKIEAPQFYRLHEQRLAKMQRAGNWQRSCRIHAKIKNCRADFLHKLSTRLVRDHNLIAVGNVSPSKLAQTRMAKSVLDAGWSAFRAMLRYKCEHATASYLEVDEAFTTQACSQCGSLPPERPKGIAGLGIRQWECSECGAIHDRDVNAARNILSAALSAQRLVGESRERASDGNRICTNGRKIPR